MAQIPVGIPLRDFVGWDVVAGGEVFEDEGTGQLRGRVDFGRLPDEVPFADRAAKGAGTTPTDPMYRPTSCMAEAMSRRLVKWSAVAGTGLPLSVTFHDLRPSSAARWQRARISGIPVFLP